MRINNKAGLDAAILELEAKKIRQEADLAEHFQITRESLNPVTLLKNSLGNLTAMPDFSQGILKTAAGLGVGFLTKKLFIGGSASILKRMLAPILEFTVAKSTVNHADQIKAYGMSLYNNFFKKKKRDKHTEIENY